MCGIVYGNAVEAVVIFGELRWDPKTLNRDQCCLDPVCRTHILSSEKAKLFSFHQASSFMILLFVFVGSERHGNYGV